MIIELKISSQTNEIFKEISLDFKNEIAKWKFTQDDLLAMLLSQLLRYRQNHELEEVQKRIQTIVDIEELPYTEKNKNFKWVFWVPRPLCNKFKFLIDDINVLTTHYDDYKESDILSGLIIEIVNEWRKYPKKVMDKIDNMYETENE